MKSGKLSGGIIALFFLCYFAAGYFSQTFAATLFLEPDKKTVKTGDNFEVTLKIDTEGEKPLSADALILFDSTNLELTGTKNPPEADMFFPEFYKRITDNKVYIGAAIGPGGTTKSGKGSIAVLMFKGAVQSHNVVSFVCVDGKTTDTNVTVKTDKYADIVKCSVLKDATYDVSVDGQSTPIPGSPTPGGSGTPRPTTSGSPSGSPTPTTNLSGTPTPSPTVTGALSPSPTLTVSPTPTGILSTVPSISPTPSGLPNTGVIESTTFAVGIGIILTVISLGIKLVL